MVIPRNVTRLDEKRLRHRARKMLDLRSLNWSQQEIADALDISRALVRKTLPKVDAATQGSLYWKLSVCDGNHAVNTPCYDLECWLGKENPLIGGGK